MPIAGDCWWRWSRNDYLKQTAQPGTFQDQAATANINAGETESFTVQTPVGVPIIDNGDAGFAFTVLPRIDIAAIYWLGDEDFASKASILFDATAHHYMVIDGLAILGNRLVDSILAED